MFLWSWRADSETDEYIYTDFYIYISISIHISIPRSLFVYYAYIAHHPHMHSWSCCFEEERCIVLLSLYGICLHISIDVPYTSINTSTLQTSIISLTCSLYVSHLLKYNLGAPSTYSSNPDILQNSIISHMVSLSHSRKSTLGGPRIRRTKENLPKPQKSQAKSVLSQRNMKEKQ
jgi:hypothetical protein